MFRLDNAYQKSIAHSSLDIAEDLDIFMPMYNLLEYKFFYDIRTFLELL